MKDDPEDDGWVYVKSRRERRLPDCKIYRSVTLDEDVCKAAREKVLCAVTQVLKQARGFLGYILKKLSRYVHRGSEIRVVALGLGSPTSVSMPLARSFCYQFASCLIVSKLLEVKNIDIFDPIMDVNDVEVCHSLIRGDLPIILDDLYSLMSSPWLFEEERKSKDNGVCLLLWMPHCEAELYKAVLLDVERGIDPLASAKALAGQEHSSATASHHLCNVMILGNSLKRYYGEKRMPQHLLDRMVESSLPDFEPYYNAFSDSYITEFKTPG